MRAIWLAVLRFLAGFEGLEGPDTEEWRTWTVWHRRMTNVDVLRPKNDELEGSKTKEWRFWGFWHLPVTFSGVLRPLEDDWAISWRLEERVLWICGRGTCWCQSKIVVLRRFWDLERLTFRCEPRINTKIDQQGGLREFEARDCGKIEVKRLKLR